MENENIAGKLAAQRFRYLSFGLVLDRGRVNVGDESGHEMGGANRLGNVEGENSKVTELGWGQVLIV